MRSLGGAICMLRPFSPEKITMSFLHQLSPLNFLAIGLGASLGAWSRWLLGLMLNPLLVAMPLGTLAANLIGGYLIGIAVAVFHLNTQLPLALLMTFGAPQLEMDAARQHPITLRASSRHSRFHHENHRPSQGLP